MYTLESDKITAWPNNNLGKGPPKNYESLDICPNWVYPTYLKA